MKKMELIEANQEHEKIAYTYVCALEQEKLDEKAFHQVWEENRLDDSIRYYVLIAEDEIAGFCSLRIRKQLHHCAKIAEIEEFIVQEDKRRMHYGSYMFHSLREKAIQEGCIQLELSSRDTRKEAHLFYRSQGMAQCHFKFTNNLV